MSRVTINRGSKELKSRAEKRAGYKTRVRRPRTHDRRRLHERDPGLAAALDRLLEPRRDQRGPRPLRWTCRSTRDLAGKLPKSHAVCPRSVAALLREMGFRLQGNRKPRKTSDRKRGDQYRLILSLVRQFYRSGCPVIWITLQEKRLLGRAEARSPDPRPPGDFDLIGHLKGTLRKAIARRHAQYLMSEHGWIDAGIGQESVQMAASCIWQWWRRTGRREYARADKILVIAEGGQAGRQLGNCKPQLQELSQRLGRDLHVCHFPAGTTRWTDIKQKLVTLNVTRHRGRPHLAHLTTISVIGRPGRKPAAPTIRATVDRVRYAAANPPRLSVQDGAGGWNLTISRRPK